MKRFKEQNGGAQKLSHKPSGRQSMLPDVPQTAGANVGDEKNLRQRNRQETERLTNFEGIDERGSSKKGERASREKWKKVSRRADEIALNKGKGHEEKGESDTRRAKRELLGLQTQPDPDNPSATKKPKSVSNRKRRET